MEEQRNSERLCRLALYLALKLNTGSFHRVIRQVGSAEEAFSERGLNIAGVNLTPLLTFGLIEEAHERFDEAEKSGVDIIIWGDDNYPSRLDEIPDPPPILWVKGTLSATDQYAVALVGSRRASREALNTARSLGRQGARRGLTIISGLAKGIDAEAHLGALDGGGRTLAVLGSGLNWVYPKENAQLYERVVGQGALISEFPPEVQPYPINFPRRNRVVAGLSLAVVVVEAGQKSGALITARLALELNREVMAAPGPAGSSLAQGSNNLIKTGAALVESIDEVLVEIKPRLLEGLQAVKVGPETVSDELPESGPPIPEATAGPAPPDNIPAPFPEGSPEALVVAALKSQGRLDLDSLSRSAGLPLTELLIVVLNLEMDGHIAKLSSGMYEITNK